MEFDRLPQQETGAERYRYVFQNHLEVKVMRGAMTEHINKLHDSLNTSSYGAKEVEIMLWADRDQSKLLDVDNPRKIAVILDDFASKTEPQVSKAEESDLPSYANPHPGLRNYLGKLAGEMAEQAFAKIEELEDAAEFSAQFSPILDPDHNENQS